MNKEIENIIDYLCSEKISERKTGRNNCELYIKQDITNAHLASVDDWTKLIQASYSYEIKESDKAQKEKKKSDKSISIFVKKLLRHCIHYDLIKPLEYNGLLKSSLKILNDNFYDELYKNEHCNIICDILDIKIPHSIKDRFIISLFNYLQNKMIDKKSCTDSINNRLLKSLCRSFYKVTSVDKQLFNIIDNLMEWMCKLFDHVTDDMIMQESYALTFSDCCSCIIDSHGINFSNCLFQNIKVPLQIIIRQLSSNQFREVYRDQYLRFLLSYFNLSVSCHWNISNPICSIDPLYDSLERLCNIFISEEYLNSLIIYSHSKINPRQVRDTFISGLNDARIKLNFEVISRACCLHQLHIINSNNIDNQTNTHYSPSNKNINPNSSSSSSSSSSSRRDSEQSNKKQKQQSIVLKSFIDCIFDKIKHSSRSSTRGNNHSLTSFSSTQSIGSSGIISLSASKNSFEAYLLILINMCNNFPKGDFLQSNSSNYDYLKNNNDDDDNESVIILRLLEIIQIMRTKLSELVIDSVGGENYLVCYVILTLVGLSQVSSNIINSFVLKQESSEYYTNDDGNIIFSHINELKVEWSQVVKVLLSNKVFLSNQSCIRINSLSELVIVLINSILSHSLLDPGTIWTLQQIIWQLPIHSDPRLIESGEYFHLLSTLINLSQNEIPKNISNSYVTSVIDESYCNQGPFVDTIPITHSNETKDISGPLLGTLFLVYWLEIQLHLSSSSSWKLTLKTTKRVCESLTSLFQPNEEQIFHDSNYIDLDNSEYLSISTPHFNLNWLELDIRSDNDDDIFSNSIGCRYKNNFIINKKKNNETKTEKKLISMMNIFDKSIACIDKSKKSLVLLDLIKDRLSNQIDSEKQRDYSFDNLSSWQLVSFVICESYLIHCEYLLLNTGNDIEWQSVMEQAIENYWCVLSDILSVLQFRIKFIRFIFINEYLEMIIVLLNRMINKIHSELELSLNERINRLKTQCCNLFLLISISIRDEVVPREEGASNNAFDTVSNSGNRYNSNSITSISSSIHPTHPVQFDEDDNDDDFMFDDNFQSLANRTSSCLHSQVFNSSSIKRTNRLIRLVFTPDQEKSFISSSQGFIITLNNNKRANEIYEILGIFENNNNRNKATSTSYVIRTESLLNITHKLIQTKSVNSPVIFGMIFLREIDWSIVFYYKLLVIILNLIENEIFSENINDSLAVCFTFLFSLHVIDNSFSGVIWRIKALQIMCVGRMLDVMNKLDGVSLMNNQLVYHINYKKEDIRLLFLNALSDIDIRVRLTSARYISLVLTLFKKPQRVYLGSIESTFVLICQIKANCQFESMNQSKKRKIEDTNMIESNMYHLEKNKLGDVVNIMESVTTAICISRMGAASTLLTSQAIFDIMQICCSRIKYNKGQKKFNEHELHVPIPNLNDLMVNLLQFIAHQCGYQTIQYLLIDHLRYLITRWINVDISSILPKISSLSSLSAGEAMRDPCDDLLELSDFPFELLKIENINTFSDFLKYYSNLIVPIICQIDDSTRRYNLIRNFTAFTLPNDADKYVAQIVKNNFNSIKSNEFLIFHFVSICEKRLPEILLQNGERELDAVDKFSNQLKDISANIQKFTKGILLFGNFDELTFNNLSDYVYEIFYLLSYSLVGPFEYILSPTSSELNKYDIITVLNSVLEEIFVLLKKFGLKSIKNIFELCNVIDIIVLMRTRIKETQSTMIRTSIIGGLFVIVEYLPESLSLPLLQALIATIISLIQTPSYYSNIIDICTLFLNISQYFVKFDRSKVVNEGVSRIYIKEFLRNYFSDLLCFLHALKTINMINKISSSTLLHKAYNSSSIYIQIDSGNMDGDDESILIDSFISSYYSTIIHRDDNENLKPFSQEEINVSIELLNETIHNILKFYQSNYSDENSIIDISLKYIDVLNEKSKDLFIINTTHSFKDRIVDFISISRLLVMGETHIPISLIWLLIVSISENLGNNSNNDLWDNDKNLCISLTSVLVSLCSMKIRVVSIESMKVLNREIILLLGLLGPPDYFNITHNQLPRFFGNILSSSQSDNQKIKLFILQKVYSYLWESPKVSREASSVLRCFNYFKIFDQLKDIKEFSHNYTKISLLPRYHIANFDIISNIDKRVIDIFDYCSSSYVNIDAWSDNIWTTSGKTYNTWVCNLTNALISSCYNKNTADIKATDSFIAPLINLCLFRHDFAESVLPLIIYDLLCTGRNSITNENISQRFKEILSPRCNLPQATQLVINILVYLLYTEILKFKEKTRRRQSKVDVIKDPDATFHTLWSLPYSYLLQIDYKYAAAAAVRCDCVCAALLFIELHDETRRSEIFLSENSERNNNKILSQFKYKMKKNSDGMDNSDSNLLMNILTGIHDPDAIYGVNPSTNLHLQAMIYAHTGSWMEALSTYESLIHLESNTNIENEDSNISSISPQLGVAQSLRGLGSQHVLSNYSKNSIGPSSNSVKSVASESLWRLERSDADANLRKWSNNISMSTDSSISTSRLEGTSPSIISTQRINSNENLQSIQDDYNNTSNINTIISSDISKEYFNGRIASAIRDLKRCDISMLLKRIERCADTSFPRLQQMMSEETAKNIVSDICRTQQLVEISEASNIVSMLSTSTVRNAMTAELVSNGVDLMLTKWQNRLDGCASSTVIGEAVLSLRLTLITKLYHLDCIKPVQALRLMDQVHEVMKGKSSRSIHALSPIVYRLRDLLSNELNTVKYINSNQIIPSDVVLCCGIWNLHECKFLWKKGIIDVAMSNLDTLVINPLKSLALMSNTTSKHDILIHRNIECNNVLSEAYRTRGEWMSNRRAATGTDILSEYLNPAVKVAKSLEEKIKSHTALGIFNERLYQSIKGRLSSPEWKLSENIALERRSELDRCLLMRKNIEKTKKKEEFSDEDKALVRHLLTLQRETEIEFKERKSVEESVEIYLLAAINEFRKVLKLSKENNLEIVFRVINLWLTNSDNDKVNKCFVLIIEEVPSYKFVPLFYQISSRLGASDDNDFSTNLIEGKSIKNSFQNNLSNLVYKLCLDHPHHTLPQLFALKNEGEIGDKISGAKAFKSNMSSDRVESAKYILQKLKQKIENIICPLEILLESYIALASTSTADMVKQNKIKDIGFKEVQGRNNCFHDCLNKVRFMPAVLTLSNPLRKDKNYSQIVVIIKFNNKFSITEQGLSRPKIIQVEASDGCIYKELVKGGDDMRQDAVMEQVFEHVNQTLHKVEETKKRKLGLRTYKIVPTTPQSGVVQWVNNAGSLGSYLIDRNVGLHHRYYPNNWSNNDCREYFKKTTSDNLHDRHDRFVKIMDNFPPVFRFFFLENFADITQWVTSRLAYTRSVAVNSIVGYILGIGDRHTQNIMLDEVTGEVIHIDFGIAYEQGKGLGTPETVPFRLTRDLIDGFGITGVEGTFRHSCQEVLRVLRENSIQLQTILEVVIHDPLYKWSLSPLQARKRQDNIDQSHLGQISNLAGENRDDSDSNLTSNKTNKFGRDAAEKTLLRIKNKLQGFDDPTGEGLSIEGQVEVLINESRNPNNLCKLFVGWAPWL